MRLRGVVAFEEGDRSRAHVVEIEDETMSAAFQLAMVETDRVWSRIAETAEL